MGGQRKPGPSRRTDDVTLATLELPSEWLGVTQRSSPRTMCKVGIAGQAVWLRNIKARTGLRDTQRSVGAI